MKRLVGLIIVGFSFFMPVAASQFGSLDQYRMELGAWGGVSFYIGDANMNRLFHRSQPAFGGFVRYNFNPRYALKLSATRASVAGDTRDFQNNFPDNAYAYFQRNFIDIGLNLEFNFVNFGLPTHARDRSRFSPYIFVGVGLTGSQDGFNDMTRLDFNFPFGLGVKYKLGQRFNIGMEWSLHTLFVDDFDVMNSAGRMLDNPYGHRGISRLKNNDRYSIAKAFVSIDLFRRRHC